MFGKLLLLFILVPLAELFLFIELGGLLGLPATLLIIVATGALGAWLTKWQGSRALARFREASAAGRLPHQEVLDGLLILLAGAVLLTPGFLTDTVGFLMLLPPVRAIARKTLGNYLKSRLTIITPPTAAAPQSPHAQGDVIDVEVVEDQ